MTGRNDLDRKLIAAVDRLSRALRVARQQVATDHQVSLLQLQVLGLLTGSDGLRVGRLASELDVTQPTISDALTSLEGKGVVQRQPDPADRRATVVSLTSAGRTMAAEVADALAPTMDAERATSVDHRGAALHVVLDEIRRLQVAGVITINRSCLSCDYYQPPGDDGPAHCRLLDEPLRPEDLRVDCPEHSAA